MSQNRGMSDLNESLPFKNERKLKTQDDLIRLKQLENKPQKENEIIIALT